MKNPWFKEEHEIFRKTVRKFMETELAPHAEEWEEAKKHYYVQALKLTERGLLPGKELQRLGLESAIPVLEPMGVIG